MSSLVRLIASEEPTQGEPSNFNFNAPGGPSGTVPQAAGGTLLMWNALLDLIRFDRPILKVRSSVRVERNDVDCVLTAKEFTGHAMFIYSTQMENLAGGTAKASANRLTSLQASVAAAVIGASAATVNDNIVVAPRRTVAFGVAGVVAVAITGNVVEGRAVLPAARPFPAPLNTWLPLNTIVP